MMAAYEYMVAMVTFACLYAIFAIGLNVIWGFTGLINIGHVAFFAIGAYASALLTLNGFPFPIGVLAGLLIAGFFGFLIGIPTLRLREDYLAIVTLGFAEIVRLILLNEEWLTRGPMGLAGVPQPLRDAIPWDYNTFYLLLVVACLIGVYVGVERAVKSPFGRVLRAIREDEEAARSLGKNVFNYKVQSLILGASIAGLAGSLFAHFITFLSPDQFESIQTFYIWIIVVIGGSGNNKGTILGAFLLMFFFEGMRFIKDFLELPIAPEKVAALRLVIVGVLLIAMMMYKPRGIMGEEAYAAGR